MAPVTVRGEGGAEFDMDVPAEGTVHRELFDDAVAKGRLTVVEDPDGLLSDGDPDAAGGGAEGTPPAPAPEPADDESELPAKSANKPEWVAYAISQGADPADAEAATKDQLVDIYGGDA